MDCITKIAAVEMTTAIWEYDPSLPNNHMLNSSLDVVAAIQILAIKVCPFLLLLSHHLTCRHRSSLLVSALRRSKPSSLRLDLSTPSSSPFTATSGGEQPTECWVCHTNSIRCVFLLSSISHWWHQVKRQSTSSSQVLTIDMAPSWLFNAKDESSSTSHGPPLHYPRGTGKGWKKQGKS